LIDEDEFMQAVTTIEVARVIDVLGIGRKWKVGPVARKPQRAFRIYKKTV
jgi:hypothetical protein